ncbi:DUF3820 family protein [Cyclobacterium sp.]|uniref:putative quorum-sensing-regulated virulence factor n=1 Tax=Cyclobacterium sp. TaxID=1966343 RepID=UPI0019A8ED52|nr:DUF3820 family protein [Cyclobacterium sp.]MBD3627625.1 DUF3820 family protein [Cyclobacterium sp.]
MKDETLMPFGKYENIPLAQVPEKHLTWMYHDILRRYDKDEILTTDEVNFISYIENKDVQKRSFCVFQMSCAECYEIFHQDEYFVKVDEKGEPLGTELKRVFSYSEFNMENKETCCSHPSVSKNYNYSPIYEHPTMDDELPF